MFLNLPYLQSVIIILKIQKCTVRHFYSRLYPEMSVKLNFCIFFLSSSIIRKRTGGLICVPEFCVSCPVIFLCLEVELFNNA